MGAEVMQVVVVCVGEVELEVDAGCGVFWW
jgi:hypothetical protein